MIKRTLIAFSLLLLSSLWASAHKFYTSLTQVEYNAKTHSAEVIMNLFTEDLETAVSNFHKKKIRSTDDDFKMLCYRYLDSKFGLQDSKNRVLKNEYLGLEFKRDMVSVYFEVKVAQGLKQVHLKQLTLLETYADQTNIVNVKAGSSKKSLVFRAGAPDLQIVNF